MNSKLRLVLMGVVVAAVVAWAVYGVYSMLSKPSDAPRKAPKISLIPMAPPPPPPPKEEKKPEPPKEQKEEKRQQVEPPKDAPPAPPSQDLKMDGPAGDGPSAFSAGKVTNEDLSSVGKPTGPVAAASGLFNPFVNYGNLLKGELQRKLSRNKDIRSNAYSVEVHVWVGKDGTLIRHELAKGTGDAELDAQINQAIVSVGTFTQQPPEKMPMPIRLLISTGRR